MPLEKIGVEAVVENLPGFNRALGQVESAVSKTSASLGRMEDAQSKAGAAAASMGDAAAGAGVASAGLGVALGAVAAAAAVATVAIGTVGAAMGVIHDLFQRGAGLRGIAESFDILVGAMGESADKFMGVMREAAAGALSDIDLMKQASFALTGVQKDFGEQFLKDIPALIKFARVEAIATGQSFEYLYNSLVLGIKRASVRIIDNAGLVLKIGEANEAYAASIGKTVSQLTAQEQQMALLKATVDAAREATELLSGVNETAEIKVQRLNSTIQNTLNAIATALQPAYEALLDGIQPIFDFLSEFATAAVPYIEALASMFADLVDQILGPIGEALGALNAGDLAKGFFTGGARIIGSLAGGMASAARTYIVPVIKAIANLIASFLSGFSPPPEGPLSTIDIGGANVMKAWLEGFMGVSLDPVAQVAAQVAAFMGSIATATREVVEGRLKELDAALAPFQDRLDIVKSQFEALRAPVEAAFSSIDRQLEKGLLLLNKGVEGSGAMIRQLDTQRQQLEDHVDAQQEQIDKAQVQLSLAQAQQAVERTNLEIRLRMLGLAPKEAAALARTSTARSAAGPKPPAVPKPKKGGGGGEKSGGGAGGGGLTGGSSASKLADLVSLEQTKGELGDAFSEGFEGAGGDINALLNDIDEIGETGATINKGLANLGEKINKAFEDAFGDPSAGLIEKLGHFAQKLVEEFGAQLLIKLGVELPAAIEKGVGDIFASLTPAALDIGIVFTQLWADIVAGAQTGWEQISTTITTWWDSVKLSVQTTAENLLFDLSTLWTNLDLEAQRVWDAIWLFITTTAENIWHDIVNFFDLAAVDLEVIQTGIEKFIKDTWNGLIAWVASIAGSVKSAFAAVGKAITDALAPLDAFLSGVVEKIAKILGFKAPQGGGVTGIDSGQFGMPDSGKRVHGGKFRAGQTLMVGEAGREIVQFGTGGFVVPNHIVETLDKVWNMMPRSVNAVAAGSNATTYNQQWDQSNQTVNLNGVPGMNDAMRRYAMLRAMGRIR